MELYTPTAYLSLNNFAKCIFDFDNLLVLDCGSKFYSIFLL